MKKLFVCAMAAMVALASCTKTELVDNSAPTPIAFKAVTGNITKAEQSNTLSGDISLGVIAFTNKDNELYFEGNIKGFVADNQSDPTYWGNTTAFWPFQSSLDFIVYAPYTGSETYNETNKILTIPVDNTNYDSIDDQIDYLYGVKYDNGTDGNDDDTNPDGYNKDSGNVPAVLKHALSKITLSFKGQYVTVHSVELVTPSLSGQYTVNYTDGTGEINWTTKTPIAGNLTLSDWSNTTYLTMNAATTVSIMVVPNNDSDIIITYTIDGTNNPLSATIPLTSTWVEGTHYVYDITVSPQTIKFAPPTVSGWDDPTTEPGDITIN